MKPLHEYTVFIKNTPYLTTRKKAKRIRGGQQKRPNRGSSHDLKH